MQSIETIRELFEDHGGIMRTADIYASGIYYKDIQRLIDTGILQKVRYGYYQLINDISYSEVSIINRLFPDAVLCMNTALFYHEYSDRTPLEWHLAVSKDASKSRFKIDYPFVKPYYIEPDLLNVGLADGEIDGNAVRVYDKERCICDCIRYAKKMDKEVFNKAIQGYINDPKKDVPKLLEYAKLLRVSQKVKDLIGVWL